MWITANGKVVQIELKLNIRHHSLSKQSTTTKVLREAVCTQTDPAGHVYISLLRSASGGGQLFSNIGRKEVRAGAFEQCNVSGGQKFVVRRSQELPNPAVTEALLRFQLVPGGPQNETADACIHCGDLNIDGDFAPPSWIAVIDGDLHVSGKVSTWIEGGDGHVTLVVFGDLKCGSVNNDWASIIFVSGDAIAREWVFASREDSSMVVGGDFRTPIFIGVDIWVSVGGSVEMEYGYGYAVALAWFADAYGAPQIQPTFGWRELAMKLGLGQGRIREEQLIELLEERLQTTGSLFRPV